MDFRSQLSAFQNSGSSSGSRGTNSGGGRGGNPSNTTNSTSTSTSDNHHDSRSRSPGRHTSNYNHDSSSSSNSNNRTNYGRGGGDNSYGRGGSVDSSRNNGGCDNYSRGRGDYGRGRGDSVRGEGGTSRSSGSGGGRSDGRDYRSRDSDYGQGGSDRRRPRPEEWNDPHQGLSSNTRRRYNAPDPDGLGDLRRFGYRIPNGFPRPPTPQEMAKKPKHLALLAITIDDLHYEHIWKGWCNSLSKVLTHDGEDDQYFISLVCHAKYPKKVKSEWLRDRLLFHPPKPGRGNSYMDPEFYSLTPAWGSIDITRAMLDLLQDGLKIGQCTEADKRFSSNRFVIRTPSTFHTNTTSSTTAPSETEAGTGGSSMNGIPPVDHFLYISETCLPVVTAKELFDRVEDSTVSWVNARNRKQEDTPRNKYEDDQFAGINRRIPGQYRWKGDQWVLLSRRHASKIIELDRPHISMKHQLWQSFQNINASDEMYIPTVLALLGYLRYTSDGQDTQRPRDPNATPLLSGPSNDTSGVSSSDTPSASLSKNECILLKPVTYTDWSVGMKNPATFSHGLTDLKRIGKIARDKGCLIARKFAPYIAVPGVPRGELKITGEISLTGWEGIMDELRSIEDAETSAKSQPTVKTEDVEGVTASSATSSVEPIQVGQEETNVVGQNHDENHDTAESTFQPTEPTEAECPDDDEEENQL